MKLPWDKKYLKIAFHVIVTVIAIYILYLAVNLATYLLTDFSSILANIGGVFQTITRIFSVLIMSFVIAYLFDPLVDFFQSKYNYLKEKRILPFNSAKLKKHSLFKKLSSKRKKPVAALGYTRRTAGTAITYVIILSVLIFALAFLFYKIGSDANGAFTDNIISSVSKSLNDLLEFYNSFRIRLEELEITDFISDIVTNLVTALTNFTKSASNNILSVITSAGAILADFLMSLIVAFYFLRDKEHYKERINLITNNILPEGFNVRARNLLSDIHSVFSGYIRGQLADALIVGVLISTALSVIGVKFSVIIGIASGLAQIIPYFGAVIAFIISVAVALFSGEPVKALYAGIVIIVIQQIDGMFIVPRVVGKKVQLSPAMVILSLSIGGALLGITGMIFAVPVFAVIKTLLTRYIERKNAKRERDSQA